MELVELPTRFGGGLNLSDAPDALADTEARVLENLRLAGRGWIASRKATVELSAPDGDVVAIAPYNHAVGVAGVLLVWDSVLSLVELWTVDGYGGSATNVGTVPGYGSGVTSRPFFTGAVLGKVLFFADISKTNGLVCYDPNDVLGSGVTMFQPTFDFDVPSAHAVAKPRVVVEHRNHLWIFGYGDEADPDRGEVARFSYLGIVDDGQGAGDAGIGGATGSTDLFDTEDAVPVAPRGDEVVAAASASDRLVLATEREASVIYGSGRSTWRRDSIDNQRGCVNTRAMIEADGVVYWLSPLGPCRYRGGGVVEDLSEKIDPIMDQIDFSTCFAAHHPNENHVRWYYRRRDDTTAGCDRWFGIDYLHGAYVADTLKYRVFCAGSVRPSDLIGPLGAPSSLTHPTKDITDSSAIATWRNGDTSPQTRTRVHRKEGVGGTYALLETLPSGASSYAHTGLKSNTTYFTKVEHVRNGQASTAVEASFTTLQESVDAPPAPVLRAEDSPVLSGSRWTASVLLSWTTARLTNVRSVHIERDSGAGYTEIASVRAAAVSRRGSYTPQSYRDRAVSAGTSYTYRIRVLDGYGNYSVYSNTPSVTPTIDSFPESGFPDFDPHNPDPYGGAR